MEDNKELSPKEEKIITLNQSFRPFDPQESPVIKRKGGSLPPHHTFSTELLLECENLKIPIDIFLYPSKSPINNTITAFEPEAGYVITNEDFDPQQRAIKREKIDRFLTVDFKKYPMILTIEKSEYSLNKYKLNEKEKMGHHFSKEMLEILKHLRAQVSIGSGRFEAKIWQTALDLGKVKFLHFYPTDFGPLQGFNWPTISGEGTGFSLALPDDPEKLATIKMKFVLAQDTPEEAAAKKADQPL